MRRRPRYCRIAERERKTVAFVVRLPLVAELWTEDLARFARGNIERGIVERGEIVGGALGWTERPRHLLHRVAVSGKRPLARTCPAAQNRNRAKHRMRQLDRMGIAKA